MPLPIILGIVAATGVGMGIHGGVKMKQANDKLKEAQRRNDLNNARLERVNQSSCKAMDVLGKNEMKVLAGFKQFSDLFERIKNPPEFADVKIGNVSIPKFKREDIKMASVGATNAALATLGGGSIVAGEGVMTILGATTLGVGLLVGGVIFSMTGSKLSGKADEAWNQMIANEKKNNIICNYLFDLQRTAQRYNDTLLRMQSLYTKQLDKMRGIIESYSEKRINWYKLSQKEQLVIENMVLIVGVLYNMCKVQLIQKSKDSEQNIINKKAINKAEKDAEEVMLLMQKAS